MPTTTAITARQSEDHADEGRSPLTRRSFLASAAAAPLLAGVTAATEASSLDIAHAGPHGESRRSEALQIRMRAAMHQHRVRVPRIDRPADEERFPSGIASFCKGLPHDQHCEVDRHAYNALLRALRSGAEAEFESIPMGGTAKLASPRQHGPFSWKAPTRTRCAFVSLLPSRRSTMPQRRSSSTGWR